MPFSRQFFLVALSIGFATSAGCSSGRYPVTGVVHYADGTPVDAGTVIAEASVDGALVGLQGNIEKDGVYQLGGVTAGDGAFPGKYRIAVMSASLGDSEIAAGKTPSVDGKFSRFETSGITFEVKPEKNKLDIEVS